MSRGGRRCGGLIAERAPGGDVDEGAAARIRVGAAVCERMFRPPRPGRSATKRRFGARSRLLPWGACSPAMRRLAFGDSRPPTSARNPSRAAPRESDTVEAGGEAAPPPLGGSGFALGRVHRSCSTRAAPAFGLVLGFLRAPAPWADILLDQLSRISARPAPVTGEGLVEHWIVCSWRFTNTACSVQ